MSKSSWGTFGGLGGAEEEEAAAAAAAKKEEQEEEERSGRRRAVGEQEEAGKEMVEKGGQRKLTPHSNGVTPRCSGMTLQGFSQIWP